MESGLRPGLTEGGRGGGVGLSTIWDAKGERSGDRRLKVLQGGFDDLFDNDFFFKRADLLNIQRIFRKSNPQTDRLTDNALEYLS